MKMHTRDKKKERLIIFSTIVGMVVVLIVWGFQLHTMFTNVVAKEGEELSQEYVDTIEDLELFQKEVTDTLPQVSQNFEDIITMIEEQNQAEREAKEQQESEVIESLAQEAAARLQEQQEQEVTQEEEIIDTTSE